MARRKSETIIIDGKEFVPASMAAEVSSYSRDYIGQLCRSRGLDCRRVHNAWFISHDDLMEHTLRAGKWVPKEERNKEEEARPSRIDPIDSLPMPDGDEFVSTARAAQLTGYTQDYVSQLARAGKVASQNTTGAWFVSRKELEEHKREKDAQLAQMQAASVGLAKGSVGESKEISGKRDVESSPHFTYIDDDRPLMPEIRSSEDASPVSIKKNHVSYGTDGASEHSHYVSDSSSDRQQQEDAMVHTSTVEYRDDTRDNVDSTRKSRDFSANEADIGTYDDEKSERVPIRTFPQPQSRAYVPQNDTVSALPVDEVGSSSVWMIGALIGVAVIAIVTVLFIFPLGQSGESSLNSMNLGETRNFETSTGEGGVFDALFSIFESKARFHQE